MGPLFLLLTVLIWGTAFLAQKSAADYLGPLAMTTVRNVLGALSLAVCLLMRRLFRPSAASSRPPDPAEEAGESSSAGRATSVKAPHFGRSVFAGVMCGLPLFAAMYAQQTGIETITPGVSAFLTANYILLVPLGAALVLRRRVEGHVWIGIALALAGTWFVSMGGETLSLGRGEAWTLLCALLFAVQMLVVDHYAKACDVLVMSFVQLVTCAVVGFLILPFAAERTLLTWDALKAAGWSLFYVGVMSSGVAYTLQNFGQARTPPALAAIICSLESVVSVLAGWLIRGDVLTGRQTLGCSLVFAALLVFPAVLLASGGRSKFPGFYAIIRKIKRSSERKT